MIEYISKSFLTVMLGLLIISTSAQANDGTIQMLFGGDVTLADAYPEVVPDPFDYKWPFNSLRPLISGMDVFMVNCEAAITNSDTPQEKSFVFRMDRHMVNVFKENGINIVTLANNHQLSVGINELCCR